MFYRVRGRFRDNTAAEFRRELTDGTIAGQEPDGREIVESMERAVVTAAGEVEWSEVCYCRPPLDHERSTVYDRFFDDVRTEPIDGYESHDGRPFMAYLDSLLGPR